MLEFQFLVQSIRKEVFILDTVPNLTMTLAEFLLLYPAFMALLWIVLSIIYAYTKEWRLPWRDDVRLTVAVVIPAHNEELVIARTLECLLNQDYRHLEIHVVSDGSLDRTVEIAAGFSDRGVIVHDLPSNRGKNGVLQYALQLVETDLFLVVDADTQAEPNAISCMVQQFADPRVGAVTGGIRVQNASSLLTAMQSLEYAVIVGLAKRADQFWGGLFTVSGAAACFRTVVLREIGGWMAMTVTEDIEVSWRIQKAGYLLAYEPRGLFYVQVPSTLRALYGQRTRWAQGMSEVLRKHGDLWHSRNSALLPIAAQAVATGIWILLVCLVLISLAWQMCRGQFNVVGFHSINFDAVLSALNWTCGLFLVQTVVAGLIEGTRQRRDFWVLGLAFLYPVYYWLIIFPCFVIGATRGLFSQSSARWARTERVVARPVQNICHRKIRRIPGEKEKMEIKEEIKERQNT